MPHLEGWAATGNQIVLPAVGRHEVIIANQNSWKEIVRIAVAGQAVFAMARPDGARCGSTSPSPITVQVLELPSQRIVQTLKPGKGVLHLEFSPRGEQVWLSLRDENRAGGRRQPGRRGVPRTTTNAIKTAARVEFTRDGQVCFGQHLGHGRRTRRLWRGNLQGGGAHSHEQAFGQVRRL